MSKSLHWDFWKSITVLSIIVFGLFLIYPLFSLFVSAFQDADSGEWTLSNFWRFFTRKYYYRTLYNSFAVTICVTILAIIIGTALVRWYITLRRDRMEA